MVPQLAKTKMHKKKKNKTQEQKRKQKTSLTEEQNEV